MDGLLDGGAHMDDHTIGQRRRYRADVDLPCYKILEYCESLNLERPDYSTKRMEAERIEREGLFCI